MPTNSRLLSKRKYNGKYPFASRSKLYYSPTETMRIWTVNSKCTLLSPQQQNHFLEGLWCFPLTKVAEAFHVRLEREAETKYLNKKCVKPPLPPFQKAWDWNLKPPLLTKQAVQYVNQLFPQIFHSSQQAYCLISAQCISFLSVSRPEIKPHKA